MVREKTHKIIFQQYCVQVYLGAFSRIDIVQISWFGFQKHLKDDSYRLQTVYICEFFMECTNKEFTVANMKVIWIKYEWRHGKRVHIWFRWIDVRTMLWAYVTVYSRDVHTHELNIGTSVIHKKFIFIYILSL